VSGARRARLRRATPWLLLAAVIGLTIAYQHRSGDLAGYVQVGDLVLSGRHPYRDAAPGISTWPPFFWIIAVPLALASRLSAGATRVGWLAVNWLALYAVLALSVRLVHNRRLAFSGDGSDGRVPLASAIVLVPLLLTLRYVLSNFEHLQINVLWLAIVLGGLALVARGRQTWGAVAIGAAAALKVMPALFIPYFLWRRQLRAALLTAAWAALFTLSPVAVFGWSRYVDYLRAWRQAVEAGWGVGRMNQSVYAMLDRLIGHRLVPFAAAGVNDLPASGVSAVWLAFLATLAAVAVLAAWTMRGPLSAGTVDRRPLAEWSAVLLVAALFGTVCWKAYLVVALLPNMLLVAAWRDAGESPAVRRRLGALVLAAFALGIVAADVLVGRAVAARAEMASVEAWAGLLLLGTLFWYRWRLDQPSR
jgi:hypothetical protein